MKNDSKIARLCSAGLCAVLIACIVGAAPAPARAQDDQRVRVAKGEEGSPSSARGLLMGFFEAFNSGDGDRMQAFYLESATDDFRSRRTEEEDRALYRRLFDEMGPLEVQRMMRKSPGEASVTARSAKIPDPVEFVFTLEEGRIGGFSVRIGGPPEGGAPSLALDLPEGVSDLELAEALDKRLVRLDRDLMFSGVVLLARNGEPFYHRAYGMADRGKSIPNRTTTRFDIGSITKLITKTAVGQLLRGGKLRLDDTVAKVLPDYPHLEIAGRITIQQLLDHRSGLGDIFNDRWDEAPKDKLIRPGDFFSLFADLPLQFEPGTGRSYSNAGYIVLGAIVETASGKPYAEYVEKKIFQPSGMVLSGFPAHDGTVSDVAIGYTREGAEGAGGEARPNLGMLPLRGCPAGSSSHAAEDLLKLDRALRDGSLLGPWTDWAFTGVPPAKGAAKQREAGAVARHGVGVAGGGPGVNAGLESDGDTTVIVLANLDPPIAVDLAGQISRALSD